MPDDYFNQKQYPRYAAGSDMDSIRTGKQVNFNQKPKKQWPLVVAAVLAFLFVLLPKIMDERSSQQDETSPQVSGEYVSPASSYDAVATGEPTVEMEDAFFSSDSTKLTVKSRIVNNLNRTIFDIELTYYVTNEIGDTLATTTKKLNETIPAGESSENTEIIDLGTPPQSKVTIHAQISYQYRR